MKASKLGWLQSWFEAGKVGGLIFNDQGVALLKKFTALKVPGLYGLLNVVVSASSKPGK